MGKTVESLCVAMRMWRWNENKVKEGRSLIREYDSVQCARRVHVC